MLRPASREEEPVEFREVPGLTYGWVGELVPRRSWLWTTLGAYPLMAWIIINILAMAGVI